MINSETTLSLGSGVRDLYTPFPLHTRIPFHGQLSKAQSPGQDFLSSLSSRLGLPNVPHSRIFFPSEDIIYIYIYTRQEKEHACIRQHLLPLFAATRLPLFLKKFVDPHIHRNINKTVGLLPTICFPLCLPRRCSK
jgi:hypothetical protein